MTADKCAVWCDCELQEPLRQQRLHGQPVRSPCCPGSSSAGLENDSTGPQVLTWTSVSRGPLAPLSNREQRAGEDELSETQLWSAASSGSWRPSSAGGKRVSRQLADRQNRLTLDQWLCDHDWVKVTRIRPWSGVLNPQHPTPLTLSNSPQGAVQPPVAGGVGNHAAVG